jgi:KipI family sensor histidine kinase inhibitor
MTAHAPAALAPRFLNSGDGGLTVEFGEEISEAINTAVIALGEALMARDLRGLCEIIPTYRSLLLLFDPVVLPRCDLVAAVQASWPLSPTAIRKKVLWRVPVLYGGEAGIDLTEVARLHGLSEQEVVALHSGAEYRVYMLGFAPGFAYLGGLPEAIHTSRRTDPRLKTPPCSVSIGGQQTAVSPPLEIPSGWRLLGRTPVRSYDPARSKRPFLFEPGNFIRFEPIGHAEYDQLCTAAESGEIVARLDVLDV